MISFSLMVKFVIVVIKVKFSEYFYTNADPRVRDKWLMGSPITISSISLCYLLIVSYIIPKFMKNRKPLNIKIFYKCVDKILLLLESYFVYWGVYFWIFVYNWKCQSIDQSESIEGSLAVELCWQYLIAHFLYIFQSILHALNKRKSSLATFAIIYHTIIPLLIWCGVNYYPGGHVSKILKFISLKINQKFQVTFIGFVNVVTFFITRTFRLVIVYFPSLKEKNYTQQVHLYAYVSITFFC